MPREIFGETTVSQNIWAPYINAAPGRHTHRGRLERELGDDTSAARRLAPSARHAAMTTLTSASTSQGHGLVRSAGGRGLPPSWRRWSLHDAAAGGASTRVGSVRAYDAGAAPLRRPDQNGVPEVTILQIAGPLHVLPGGSFSCFLSGSQQPQGVSTVVASRRQLRIRVVFGL